MRLNVCMGTLWHLGKGCKALAARGRRFHVLSSGAEYPSYATGCVLSLAVFSVRFKFDRNRIIILGILLQTAIVLVLCPNIVPFLTFLNFAYLSSRKTPVEHCKQLWSAQLWSSFKRSLSAVCFCFLHFLRLAPLTYFLQTYVQYYNIKVKPLNLLSLM